MFPPSKSWPGRALFSLNLGFRSLSRNSSYASFANACKLPAPSPAQIRNMAAAPEQPQSLAAYTKSVLSGDTLILRGKVVQNNALPR